MIRGKCLVLVVLLTTLFWTRETAAFSRPVVTRREVTTLPSSVSSRCSLANHNHGRRRQQQQQQQQQRRGDSSSFGVTELMAHLERRQGSSRTKVLDPHTGDDDIENADPAGLPTKFQKNNDDNERFIMAWVRKGTDNSGRSVVAPVAAAAATTTLVATSSSSSSWFETTSAAHAAALNLSSFGNNVNMTPETFQPVCGASDGFYRFLQQSSVTLIGNENYDQYKPLIAGGLLRVRLELCVVESFLNEAVVPFIRDNGLSWVLPWHETVETFIAGAIFAFATTFVFIGSTKILTVIVTYTDFLFGLPARLLGGFAFDRAQSKPVTFDLGFGPFKTRVMGPSEEELANQAPIDITKQSIPTVLLLFLSGAVNYFGKGLGLMREVLEAIDFFVGRYLVLWASLYLIIKFLHFKVFPDFP